MGQQEIYKALKEMTKNEWISTKKLTLKLKATVSTVSSSLKSMRNYGEIESRRVKFDNNYYMNEHRLTERGRE